MSRVLLLIFFFFAGVSVRRRFLHPSNPLRYFLFYPSCRWSLWLCSVPPPQPFVNILFSRSFLFASCRTSPGAPPPRLRPPGFFRLFPLTFTVVCLHISLNTNQFCFSRSSDFLPFSFSLRGHPPQAGKCFFSDVLLALLLDELLSQFHRPGLSSPAPVVFFPMSSSRQREFTP